MTELKKCPLCNSVCKTLSTTDDDNYPLEHHKVYCTGENCGYEAGDWRTLDAAIKNHNSRPIEDALSNMWQAEHAEKLTLIEKLKFAEERIKYLRATIMNEIEDDPIVDTESMMFQDKNGG